MFVFNTVILYHYTINNDCTQYNICGTWCLAIKISTCVLYYNFVGINTYTMASASNDKKDNKKGECLVIILYKVYVCIIVYK